MPQTLKIYCETGANKDRIRSGRPRKTSRRNDNRILPISKSARFKTASDIQAEINNCLDAPISLSTTKRRLREKGLLRGVAVKKPLLRPQNKMKQLTSPKNTLIGQLKTGKRFYGVTSQSSNYRRQKVRRNVGESFKPYCIAPTVKHGGDSVMIWGYFCYDGVGYVAKINGIMEKNAVPQHSSTLCYSIWYQIDRPWLCIPAR